MKKGFGMKLPHETCVEFPVGNRNGGKVAHLGTDLPDWTMKEGLSDGFQTIEWLRELVRQNREESAASDLDVDRNGHA